MEELLSNNIERGGERENGQGQSDFSKLNIVKGVREEQNVMELLEWHDTKVVFRNDQQGICV